MKLFTVITEVGDVIIHANDKEDAEKKFLAKMKEEGEEYEIESVEETEEYCFPLAGFHE